MIDEPFDIETTAPKPPCRERQVALLLEGTDCNNAAAGTGLLCAMRDGVTLAEASESLRLPVELLEAIRAYGIRRMGDQVWHSIQRKKICINETEKEIEELEQHLTAIESGDVETIRGYIKLGY